VEVIVGPAGEGGDRIRAALARAGVGV